MALPLPSVKKRGFDAKTRKGPGVARGVGASIVTETFCENADTFPTTSSELLCTRASRCVEVLFAAFEVCCRNLTVAFTELYFSATSTEPTTRSNKTLQHRTTESNIIYRPGSGSQVKNFHYIPPDGLSASISVRPFGSCGNEYRRCARTEARVALQSRLQILRRSRCHLRSRRA